MSAARLHIDPVTPALGAELSGVDLSQPVSPELAAEIHRVLMDRLVVWFRDQPIHPTTVLNLARAMGPLAERHPLYTTHPDQPDVVILDWHGDMQPDAAEWHTDMRYRPESPFGSVLQAVVLPPTGGDTLWASMYRAYETLPSNLQADLAELSAVHDMGSFRRLYVQDGQSADLAGAMADVGMAVHPVVGHHAVTGRPFLNVSESFTNYIVGMSMPESQRLLTYLFGHINQPDLQVRLRWQPGTVALWDNGASQHYAVNDYLPQRRTMYRAVIASDLRAPA